MILAPACRSAHREASAYLDGELEASERRALQEHLRSCERCLAAFRATRRLSRAAADLAIHEPRRSLAEAALATRAARREAVLAGLATDAPPRPSRAVPVGVAVLVFVMIVLGAWLRSV